MEKDNNAITIASLNVWGLGNDTKRREIFNWLRSKHFSIYLLEDVHCSEKSKDLWTTEWEYTSFFSSFSSTKAGVGILFQNNFELRIMKNYFDPSGRYIICDLKANRKPWYFLNAPNEDDPNFFKTLADHMEDFQKDEIIMGGQKVEKWPPQNGARRTVSEISENLDLVDAWRLSNPDTCRYPWRQKQPEVHCRLDVFWYPRALWVRFPQRISYQTRPFADNTEHIRAF